MTVDLSNWIGYTLVRIPDGESGSYSGVKFLIQDEAGTINEIVMYSGEAYRMASAFIDECNRR